MANWIGYAVSVNCAEPLGCYQGTIMQADGTTITLTKAFRNGFPYPKSQVTLNAADIKDLRIIEQRPEPAQQTHSTVAVSKNNKKGQRATVCENLQANPTSSGNQPPVSNTASNNNNNNNVNANNSKATNNRSSGPAPARSKPIDIQGGRANKNNNHAGSYGNAGSTPKGRGGAGGGGGGGGGGAGGGAGGYDKARRRNEAFFGDPSDPALADDFDFEGNLALFDKQALWEQMRHSHKPDLVRQTDELAKFRHDENVLGAAPSCRRAIRVPDELRGPLDYVTDEGVVVPTAGPRLRRRLWEGLQRLGLVDSAYTLLARAAADVALRLVGGGRRLDPRNAHQAPTVVALVGPHRAGAGGLLAARLLHSHGARVAVLVAPAAGQGGGEGACPALERELAALRLSGAAPAGSAAELPSADVVLVALHDLRLDEAAQAAQAAGQAAALQWARAARAATVALEPPARGWEGVAARAAVAALLPAALAPALGRVYLADVAPPLALFADHRVTYRPPFGAASVLALHPADD